MAIAVERDMHIAQIDVTTAYLNGVMDTDVYMEKPEMLTQMIKRIISVESDSILIGKAKRMLRQLNEGDKVCKLNKSLYGLRQSGRLWHTKLTSTLKGFGLIPTAADPCVYHDKDNNILLLIYVDDILITSRDTHAIQELKKKLSDAFMIKDLGDVKYCLGIEVTRDREGIHLSQASYIRDVLNKFKMSDCKPVRTPMETGIKLHSVQDDTATNDPEIPYKELVGSLMYIAQGTRPDIAYAVSALSQFNSCYTMAHWSCAKRVLRYLKGTLDHGLTFTKSGKNLTGYVDADWGNCSLDRRSYTGTAFLLANAAISWEAKKQRTVALSSTEAEYTALSEAAREAIYLSGFLKEVGMTSFAKVLLHNDNQSAGKLAVNPVYHSRSKHIDIKCHFIRQAFTEHEIELTYTPTEEMRADVLTKALPSAKHHFCVDGIGIKVIDISRIRI
ncbi:PREDICTED: uncharacterized mitochondrial protein AtMg00810-like [Cyphomyrmex costatus]|nr:PREDICTED: uncharacterized mitochondrial protein AtMg00810-like [Cyphomyrmex costatus]